MGAKSPVVYPQMRIYTVKILGTQVGILSILGLREAIPHNPRVRRAYTWKY